MNVVIRLVARWSHVLLYFTRFGRHPKRATSVTFRSLPTRPVDSLLINLNYGHLVNELRNYIIIITSQLARQHRIYVDLRSRVGDNTIFVSVIII